MYDRAIVHLNASLALAEIASERARVFQDIAEASAKSGDYDMSIHYYSEAISLGLKDSRVVAGLARAKHKLSYPYLETDKLFKEAIDLDNSNSIAMDWYSTFLKENGQLTSAEDYSRRAVAIDIRRKKKVSFVLLNNLALILTEKGDLSSLKEAQDLLKQAVALAPPGFDYPAENLKRVNDLLDPLEGS